jgi:hypothetical protein
MRKLIVMACAVLLGAGACDHDLTESGPAPISLSATMKLAADSLTVSLRILNVSDTTQVITWAECEPTTPTNFAVYRDVGLIERLWEYRKTAPAGSNCPASNHSLAPDEAFSIRGAPVAVAAILGDSIAGGSYYIAVQPLNLLIRPKGDSYDTPVLAIVPAGAVDLRQF